jgi:hypothetical protein
MEDLKNFKREEIVRLQLLFLINSAKNILVIFYHSSH